MNNENFNIAPNDENEEFIVEFGEVINDGGTHDYDELDNQPQINGHTLEGNKTGEQLGLQDKINDLNTIRSGATKGATAVQPEDLARIATTGSYNDSLDKPSINNVALIGNKSLDALGIQPKGNYALESEIPDVSNFITNTVDNLVNYYKKSETFTKQEVNDLISAITTMDIRVVQTLPTEDISTTTIYFVPKTTAGTNDVYDEYVYVSNAWEHIGSTDIDLSGYQTKIDSSHKLSSDLVDDTNQTNKFVTENEKTTWNTEIYKAFPTDTASGAVASFTDGADNLPLKSLVVNIDPVQDLSQGDPSPENVCPISGWTGAQVVRTGKNLLPMEIQSGSYSYGTTITVNPDLSITYNKPTGNGWTTNVLGTFWLPAGTYTVIEDGDSSQNGRIGLKKLPSNTEIANTRWGKRITFTLTEATQIYADFVRAAQATDVIIKFMIFKGDTATASDYEPYAGRHVQVSWQVEAGTVYGGKLDVTTGVLTVNKVALTFNGSEGWVSTTANGHTRQRVNSVLIGIKQITGGGQTPNLISDRYPTKTPNATYVGTVGITNQQSSEDLYIMDNRYDYVDSASDYKTWLSTNNLKVVYELAEPVTYRLTPTEVATLLGDNTIWADTGDTTAEYRADTKLYISKMIGDAETISTRLASGGRETALYKGAINPIETNIPLEEGVEYEKT